MGYLFAAYTIIFLAIFLYLVFIWRRQVALETDVTSVQARINQMRDGVAPPLGEAAAPAEDNPQPGGSAPR